MTIPRSANGIAKCDRPDELGDRNFCDVDKLYPGTKVEETCIARPDPAACNRVEPCTDATKPYCDDVAVGVKGTCVECTGDEHCPGASCDESGACAGFTCTPGTEGDAICLALPAGSTEPLCVKADTCGQCDGTDDATQCPNEATSVCDVPTNTCRGCTDDGECSSEACDIDEGTCLDEGTIVHVAATGGNDSTTCGSPAAKCETIAYALNNRVDATRNTVIVAAGNYSEPLAIAAGTVTIIGRDKPIVTTPLTALVPAAVTISGTANLSLDGVHVIPVSGPNEADAIVCTGAGATLSVARATVSNAPNLGITASNCSLTVTQSTVSQNRGGGVKVASADYSIVNNFFTGNGGLGTTVSGVKIEGTTSQTEGLSFNTFARNQRSGTEGFALICDASDLVATNNIFMLADASSQGLVTSCATTYSLFDAESVMDTGMGNIPANADFVNPGADDYRLMPGSPGIDVADPAATLDILAVDVDGEDRFINGRSDMGAHEVPE